MVGASNSNDLPQKDNRYPTQDALPYTPNKERQKWSAKVKIVVKTSVKDGTDQNPQWTILLQKNKRLIRKLQHPFFFWFERHGP